MSGEKWIVNESNLYIINKYFKTRYFNLLFLSIKYCSCHLWNTVKGSNKWEKNPEFMDCLTQSESQLWYQNICKDTNYTWEAGIQNCKYQFQDVNVFLYSWRNPMEYATFKKAIMCIYSCYFSPEQTSIS